MVRGFCKNGEHRRHQQDAAHGSAQNAFKSQQPELFCSETEVPCAELADEVDGQKYHLTDEEEVVLTRFTATRTQTSCGVV